MTDNEKNPNWEKSTIEKLLFESHREQKRARRWRIFFRSLLFVYLFILLIPLFGKKNKDVTKRTEHAAVINIHGAIMSQDNASARNIVRSLNHAFEEKNTKGIILDINSPGGAPVQASQIYDEIKRLREKYPEKKVYSVCTDTCASAAYFIAAASDEIYANPTSLVGSIGVRLDGFGFVELMNKIGVERRLLTAGEHKAMLDPFSERDAQEELHVKRLLQTVHHEFVSKVKAGRGDRLKLTPSLFSGLFWSGVQAKDLGLIDGFASTKQVAREKLETEKLYNYTIKQSHLDRFAEKFGASLAYSNLLKHSEASAALRA